MRGADCTFLPVSLLRRGSEGAEGADPGSPDRAGAGSQSQPPQAPGSQAQSQQPDSAVGSPMSSGQGMGMDDDGMDDERIPTVEETLAAMDERRDLLDTAPPDEVVGEIFAIQGQLLHQMHVNLSRLTALAEGAT